MLEELGVAYEIKHYQRDAKTMLAPASLKAIHPLGKSPIITDGARTIAESGVIVDYLAQTYAQGQWSPDAGSDAYWQYQYFMHYAEGIADATAVAQAGV